MRAAFLPGGRVVEVRDVADPVPAHGQVLVAMRASTICGSDLRAIYREHLGEGPEAYQGVIGGHEPCGEVVAVGPGVVRTRPGDRVVIYHISGCGMCNDCRAGYQISCTSAQRRAYGWQRDGGHADLILTDEADLVALPDDLTFVDGACVACGFGTAYEALLQSQLSGRDDLVVTGLGPVGLAVALLGRALGAARIVGVDPAPQRRELAAGLGVLDGIVDSASQTALADIRDALGRADASVCVDASGVGAAQELALSATARWGRCVLVGEGGVLTIDASPALIHRNVRLIGSWVTSTVHMAELLERLVRWELHPEQVVTHRFPVEQAAEAYRVADSGVTGKVAIVGSA